MFNMTAYNATINCVSCFTRNKRYPTTTATNCNINTNKCEYNENYSSTCKQIIYAHIVIKKTPHISFNRTE